MKSPLFIPPRAALFLIGLVVVVAATAHASDPDSSQPHLLIGVGAGITDPLDPWGEAYTTGWHTTLNVSLQPARLPLRLRGRGMVFRLKEPGVIFGRAVDEGSFTAYGGLGEIVFVPMVAPHFRSYVFAGFGGFEIEFRHVENRENGDAVTIDGSNSAISYGGGMEWWINRWGLSAEFTHLDLPSDLDFTMNQFGLLVQYQINL